MAKISACIVSYCDYEEVCAAVRSVLAHTPGPDFSLYVVDNASPDQCGERLARTDFSDSRVTVICLPQNVGFGKGHNTVLDRLDSDVHFILNPDVVIDDTILPAMSDWLLRHPDVAMATPQLFFPDGRIQHLPRRKPQILAMAVRQFPKLVKNVGFCRRLNAHYTMQDEDLSIPQPIEFCTGSFMAVRTDVFKKVGGFDPDYFMYVEDADLTQRVLQEGKVYLLPQFHATHAWHRDPVRDRKKFWMQMESMFRFCRKWGFRHFVL
ncbi:MAG: glycosyltransferase family 2 protein [Gemmiger sp.]|uniref:glycosyltransferase family 2 protein n=1 Tax=Gemmiger sp. TaxID=2049027 RepID=UPI002E78687B|nr:glycosyltransferase family 2 protein [Gemmiger sp.]MEE0800144.1 glycosyltransferase family 2 protein [Gemmiger sp.]